MDARGAPPEATSAAKADTIRMIGVKTGQGQAADLRHVADVDAVYNIIEHIDELRDHRRDRQPEQESADRLRAEKRIFLIHPDAFFL